jgi:hypothetical protein
VYEDLAFAIYTFCPHTIPLVLLLRTVSVIILPVQKSVSTIELVELVLLHRVDDGKPQALQRVPYPCPDAMVSVKLNAPELLVTVLSIITPAANELKVESSRYTFSNAAAPENW